MTTATRVDLAADALASRRLLLGVLADAECERRGVVSTAAQVDETLRWYRAHFGLLRRRDLEGFLAATRLREEELVGHMRTFSNIALAQRLHKQVVDGLFPRYRAIFSARDWLLRREAGGERSDIR